MGIEKFIYVVVGVLCVWRLGVAAAGWTRRLAVPPDPWGPELTAALRNPDCVPVCLRCFTPQEHDRWFCPECGAAVGPYNNCLPYIYIFSQGEVLRNGAYRHIRPSALIIVGYLLFSIGEYGVFAPVYWWRLFQNLRRCSAHPPANDED
ncbi:MAG TPA: hypothetical protein VMV72_06410 [Verrucomicrobiae bacterium]|nr:hypothetical protein [Verrucomicrobiae bacterium]